MTTLKKDDDSLYVFLHIPKCAGTTFVRHVWCNLANDSFLEISPGVTNMFRHRAEVDERIASLTQERKDEIRVICGHSVYYGIHEHFRREARYFTFLRDPVERIISNYNFMMSNYDIIEKVDDQYPRRRDELTFDRWWKNVAKNAQVGTVLNYRLDDKPGWDPELRFSESHLEEAKRILEDFYFVGLVETFEDDSMFLFNDLNITRFLRKRQNVTKGKYIEAKDELIETIRSEIALDIELYEHARNLNREFKRNRPQFSQIVEGVRAKGRYSTPIRFVIMDTVQSLIGINRTVMVVEGTKQMIEAITRLVR